MSIPKSQAPCCFLYLPSSAGTTGTQNTAEQQYTTTNTHVSAAVIPAERKGHLGHCVNQLSQPASIQVTKQPNVTFQREIISPFLPLPSPDEASTGGRQLSSVLHMSRKKPSEQLKGHNCTNYANVVKKTLTESNAK